MKIILVIPIIYFLVFYGCSKKSTEPLPVGSQIFVSGDVIESYQASAFFGTTTFYTDSINKEYFSIYLLPNAQGSNPLAWTFLFKSGAELPAVQTYTVGKFALGEDLPDLYFGGGFSGLNTEDYAGYIMTQGTLSFDSVSESNISGEIDMSGHWALGTEEDTTRTVLITGNFNAKPVPED